MFCSACSSREALLPDLGYRYTLIALTSANKSDRVVGRICRVIPVLLYACSSRRPQRVCEQCFQHIRTTRIVNDPKRCEHVHFRQLSHSWHGSRIVL